MIEDILRHAAPFPSSFELSATSAGTTRCRIFELGVADFDLFVPDATFVLGDADRDAGSALFSLAWFMPTPIDC